MARANAEMAIDQRGGKTYGWTLPAVNAHSMNVVQTLADWGVRGKDDRILAVYFARIAELLAR